MLYRVFCLVPLILFVKVAFASDSTTTWTEWKSSWDKKIVRTGRITQEPRKHLIKDLEILDVRSDTERIALYKNEFHHICELVYDVPIDEVFSKKLSTSNGSESVLLVLKNFWISKLTRAGTRPEGIKTIIGPRLQVSKLLCSIDAFIKKDNNYFPIAQLDTVFEDERTVFYAAPVLTEKALSVLCAKLENAVSAQKFEAKKQNDKEFVASVYNRRFDIAPFKQTSIKKGIYYTWEQFKNNNPVDKEFVVRGNREEPPTVYLVENGGEEILARNIFAVVDGNKVYKIQEGFGFPIYRNNNGIYWNGFEKYDSKTNRVPVRIALGGDWFAFGTELINTNIKIRLTPYLLNVETGKEY